MSAADTIVAIATPPGVGALSLIRVSGPIARAVLARVFVPDGTKEWPPRAVRHGVLRSTSAPREEPAASAAEGSGAELRPIDDGVAWWARGPSTFTGEDVAEFTGHGGALVTARVLAEFQAAGARLAVPGEFTRRAFLNGRMDLARAEAVADVIAAATDDALRIARVQLAGGLSKRIASLQDETLDALAHVEATVDFPDEDLHPDGNEALARRFDLVKEECARLAASFVRGRLYREGARVVLAGRPNVGKSSLLNALAGRERAIVTDQPGTTRDVVEEAIDIDGLPVMLSDTAGIREVEAVGHGIAEAEGVRRSRAAAADADLVLLVYDASAELTEEDRRTAQELSGRPSLLVANKTDLGSKGAREGASGAMPVLVSARTGDGLAALKSAIRAALLGSAGSSEDVVITRARHHAALESAYARLAAAAEAARQGRSPDLIASDARRALDALGEIVGAITTEDVLGRVFERFCVGK